MGRVLVECERRNNTTEVNRSGFNLLFTEWGLETRFRYISEITEEDLNWCESYLAIRPFTPASTILAKKVKQSGRFYAVYFDDDLLYSRKEVRPKRPKHARACLSLADVVLGSNPVLVKEYAAHTTQKRYGIIDTSVLEANILLPRCDDGITKFVYAAGADHASLFETYIKPILNEFLSKYGKAVSFTFIGASPDISGIEQKERFAFVPQMPLTKYNAYMQENRFDVGLAPLINTRFSNRKYFNKYIEYAKNGMVGLYSDCLPYTLAIRNGENGFLLDAAPQKWLEVMSLMVEDKQRRAQCIANAQQDLRLHYSLAENVKKLRTAAPEFAEERPVCSIRFIVWYFRIRYRLFLIADKVYRTVFFMKGNGVSKTLNRIQYTLFHA